MNEDLIKIINELREEVQQLKNELVTHDRRIDRVADDVEQIGHTVYDMSSRVDSLYWFMRNA